jgi:osmotically-inducible protein OsmY
MAGSFKLLVAAGVGAGAAYLMDPDRGRARRAKLRDKSRSIARREMRTVERKAHYAQGRFEGVRHRLSDRQPHLPESDQVLVDKVRSEVLGRRPEFTSHVNVEAFGGVVTLRGQLADRSDIEELEAGVKAVPGVNRIVNLLHTPGEVAPNKAEAVRTAG